MSFDKRPVGLTFAACLCLTILSPRAQANPANPANPQADRLAALLASPSVSGVIGDIESLRKVSCSTDPNGPNAPSSWFHCNNDIYCSFGLTVLCASTEAGPKTTQLTFYGLSEKTPTAFNNALSSFSLAVKE